MALISCPECGNETSDRAVACVKCGFPITQPNKSQETSPAISNKEEIDEYYKQEFEKIEKGNYGGKWNWYAWLFTSIWYFIKGCYVQGVITLVATFIYWYSIPKIQEFLFGIKYNMFSELQLELLWGGLISIIAGVNGNWLYYNSKVLNKQFVSPPLSNFLKILLLVVLLYSSFVLYEYFLFKPDYERNIGFN